MPRFVPIPWIQWQRFRVTGVVRERESGRPLAGLTVCALDQDVVLDDYLGSTETDASGHFEIRFTDADFKDLVETRPDLYLCIFMPGTREAIHDTSYEVRTNASNDEYFEIEISEEALGGAQPPQP
jgi:hypothetical protein